MMDGGSMDERRPRPIERVNGIAEAGLRWGRRNPLTAVFAAALAMAAGLVVWVDAEVALALKTDLHPDLFWFFKAITDIGLGGHWFGMAIAASLFCIVASGLSLTTEAHERWRLHARSWLFLLANLAIAGFALQALKLLFGRYRPRYLFDEGLYGFVPFSGHNSFPSGHSQVIWSVAIAMWFIYPRYRALYVTAAVVVSFSRVATTVHFLSDWVVGSVLAVIIGLWLQRRFEADGKPPLDLTRHRGRA